MKTAKKTLSTSFEDFCFLVGDGQKADLIYGVIYMASPENTDAILLFMWLGGLIGLFVEALDLGEVFGSRVAMRLDERNGPEADILFVRKSRLHLVRRGHIAGPADLAMEIVSAESVQRDYLLKRQQYEPAGIKEYWIIDDMEQKVIPLWLGPNGKYRELRPKKGILHSRVLPGFWLRPEWLWQAPRPKKIKVLNEILARQHPNGGT
jgi:Uma2 family endonuclease